MGGFECKPEIFNRGFAFPEKARVGNRPSGRMGQGRSGRILFIRVRVLLNRRIERLPKAFGEVSKLPGRR